MLYSYVAERPLGPLRDQGWGATVTPTPSLANPLDCFLFLTWLYWKLSLSRFLRPGVSAQKGLHFASLYLYKSISLNLVTLLIF